MLQGLDRLQDQLQDLAHQGVSWQSQLREQVLDVRHSTDLLRRETGALSTALRKPQVRGRWGELHLRRCVELAGLVDRCDFTEQARLSGDDGTQVPDVVVHLAGGRSVVVDAKVPLDAFLDATTSDDPEEHEAHLRRHARQLRGHADALSAKAYWRALPETPEFVVLFVPGESFLSAALDAEPDLIERAAEKQVVLATPTTLIALLRTVAMGWSHATFAERTREIHTLGRDLHERLGVMGSHLDKLGRSLRGSVEAYNATVGSLEARVLVSARQFGELGVTRSDLDAAPVEEAPRPCPPSSCSRRWPSSAGCSRPVRRRVAGERGPRPYLDRVSAPTLWKRPDVRRSGHPAGGLRVRPPRGHRPAGDRSARPAVRHRLRRDVHRRRARGPPARVLPGRRDAAVPAARDLAAAGGRRPPRGRAGQRHVRAGRRLRAGAPLGGAVPGVVNALVVLAIRHRVAHVRRDRAERQASPYSYANLETSPPPTLVTSAAPEEKSTTVVGSDEVSPPSRTASSI